jgi:hypothetical protein
MKTNENNLSTLITAVTLFLMIVLGCSSDDPNPTTDPTQTGEVSGTVKDENGNPYPSTLIVASKGTEESAKATNPEGVFNIKTGNVGDYEITMELPLSAEALTPNPSSVALQANEVSTVDFVIQTQPVKAHLNFGDVQLLEEIVDENGNTPTSSNEPLFAANIFDAPLGQLNAIMAPDGHQVTLWEFKKAKGTISVHCNGKSSSLEIALEGMIPNGTYTFWLAYLNKTRKVGEQIDFMNDFVNFNNPPIGSSSGTENIAIAGADGTIQVTLEHGSCILTDEAALVIPVLYHINGKTFGGGHVPDAEEMVHMLAYFQ